MELELEQREQLKKNHKTNYLIERLETLEKNEGELLNLIKEDSSLEEMSREDLINIKAEKDSLLSDIQKILESEKEEEEFPNHIILEVRAGAGGDEASIF